MRKDLCINLPVKDIGRTKEFYLSIGLPLIIENDDNKAVAFSISDKNIMVMFILEEVFGNYRTINPSNIKKGGEILLSIVASSQQHVDELAKKVVEAGGKLFCKPEEYDGWLYGCRFADPDGHRWSVMWMES